MNDQEIHDLKKTRELIKAVKSVCESKPQLDDADVRGIIYMMRDAAERVSRTLRDTLPPEQDERRTLQSAERIAQLTAHRAVGNQEQDAANGKLAGYCAVCQVPWPCDIAKPRSYVIVENPVKCWKCKIRPQLNPTVGLCAECNGLASAEPANNKLTR